MPALIGIVLGLLVAAWFGFAMWDSSTCVRRGPERLSHMQQVGSVMIPVYTSECLERKK